jgi:hypothetical protein
MDKIWGSGSSNKNTAFIKLSLLVIVIIKIITHTVIQTRVAQLSVARESNDSVWNNEKFSKMSIKLNTQIQGEEMVTSWSVKYP